MLKFTKAEPIRLKDHPDFTERWLQDRIFEDPSILGLGDVEVIDRERRQEKAGRLDLLLLNREENCRYEVELMLGQTDESHIIRCIEYWDIERRRYPGYEHCAVLVAEDITTRFLNILSLFAGTIPFVAIQFNALKVADQVIVNFVKVLDKTALSRDDSATAELEPVDRNYWNERATPETVGVSDECLQIINQYADKKLKLKFNRYYIGMHDDIRSRNFVHFRPKKKWTDIGLELEDPKKRVERLKAAGIEAGFYGEDFIVTLLPGQLAPQRELIDELLREAVHDYQAH